jgi:uncharacterized protein (TIGR03663 family)
MSSTPHPQVGTRRAGSAARPRPRAVPPAPRRSQPLAPALAAEPGRAYSSVFDRAFPIPRITTQTLVLVGFAFVPLLLRLWMLGDKPLHHDESLHATYAWYLMGRANPEYHYDPMMHGPLQFHMIAFFYSLFGSSPFTARLWSASCGTALVLAPWLLRRQLGQWATYALMTIFTFSPIILYISRFAREDMQYGLFTFLMVAALLRYVLDRQEGAIGYYRWLYVLAAAFILAYAAKESIYLTVATLGIFIVGQFGMELLPDLRWPWLSALSRTLRRRRGSESNRWFWLAAPIVWAVVVEAIAIATKAPHATVIVALPFLAIGLYIAYLLLISERGGLLTDTVRQTPGRAWGLSLAIVVVLFVLLYWPIGDPLSWGIIPGAHVQNTTNTVNGVDHPYSYSTDGLFGGLLYWQSQIPVARGDQPWYYYLFLVPLYEWFVVLFGAIGSIYVLRRQRTFFTMFVLWWTVSTFATYAWASEKMPWNALHLVIPLSVLAAIGLVVSVTAVRRWARYLAIVAAVATALVSLHNSFTLSYVNAANPVDLMVYVQTSQNVPQVYSQMQRIQAQLHGPMHVVVDSADEWPWVFYLRDGSRFLTDAYPAAPKNYANDNQPVLLVDANNYTQLEGQFAGRYVAFHEVLRWWGPEEYKTYAQRTNPYTYNAQGQPIPPSGKLMPVKDRLGYFLRDLVTPSTWQHILQWEFSRRPFTPTAWQGDSNQLIFYFLVRKDLVQDLSPSWQKQAQQQLLAAEKADPFYTRTRQTLPTATYGAGAGKVSLSFAGPLATDAHGDTYVVDANASKVVEIGPDGTLLRSWGTAGAGASQFHFQFQLGATGGQTSGIAVGPNGDVYVADTWNQRIQQYSPTGVFLRAWGRPTPNKDLAHPQPNEFYGPRGIAVAPNGDVYVADTGNRRIQVFDANGAYRFSFGSSGSALGQLSEPSSLAIDASGHVYVADYWNRRVQIFDLHGHPLGQFPVTVWQANSYDEPAIAADNKGHVYVPDPEGARVLVYTASGQPYQALGGILNPTQVLTKPLSVAIGPGGDILVSDTGTNKVLRFAAS